MNKKAVISLALMILFVFIYTWKLGAFFSWDSDWSRDLYDTIKIAKGNISLIGPPLTGAVFAGPYYYYSLVPQLVLSGFNENAILYANALVFALSIGIVSFATDPWIGMVIGLTPFWIQAARHPGNAYTYLPLMLLLFITLKLSWRHNMSRSLEWGFLAGLAANFHPASIVVLLSAGLWKAWRSKNWGWPLTFGLTYLPLIAFEVKHKFVMTQAIISGKFLALVTSKTSEAVQIHYLLPMLLAGVLIVSLYLKDRLPALGKIVMLAFLIALFPTGLFKMTEYSSPRYEQVVDAVTAKGMISKGISFNVLGINDEEKKVVSANEFRYFLWKKGFKPLPADDYAGAKTLIIFSRLDLENPEKLDIWEINQYSKDPIVITELNTFGYHVYNLAKF